MSDLNLMYDANSNTLRLEGVHTLHPITRAKTYVNNATVTATFIDTVTGAAPTWAPDPVTMSYVAASNGIYEGFVVPALGTAEKRMIAVRVTLTGGLTGEWNVNCVLVNRTLV